MESRSCCVTDFLGQLVLSSYWIWSSNTWWMCECHRFGFMFAIPVFLWNTEHWFRERLSAALGLLPAIAEAVSRLCNRTCGRHWQCNKFKQAQLNRKQDVWVRSQFLEQLLKKETSSSHFWALLCCMKGKYKASSPISFGCRNNRNLLCHRIIITQISSVPH